MGIRGELFTTKMSCEGRTYFFNVKENRMGDVFLSIVESKPTETDSFDRRSIVIFRDDMKNFLDAFKSTLKYMEQPELKDEQVEFNPAALSAAKVSAARSGKNGADASGPAVSAAPEGEKKRRVVVRRKSSAAKSSGETDSTPDGKD